MSRPRHQPGWQGPADVHVHDREHPPDLGARARADDDVGDHLHARADVDAVADDGAVHPPEREREPVSRLRRRVRRRVRVVRHVRIDKEAT
jgi:hypothetical protein